MTPRRKLYTGEETAARGLLVLRASALGNLILAALFILFFDRAKHDPGLSALNPFADDPYDAVGSFGVQLAIACALISLVRAFRTDLKTESLYNRYTYTLRAMAVSQLAVIVTMLADLSALVRFSSWRGGPAGGAPLVACTAILLLIATAFCVYLIRLAQRREVCSKNPLGQPQIVPFLIVFGLLSVYPVGWREGIPGSIAAAAAGMIFLLYSVTILSKAMFPCPDIPERDLVDDLYGIWKMLLPRTALSSQPDASDEQSAGSRPPGAVRSFLSPRLHEWNIVVTVAVVAGLSLALAEFLADGSPHDVGRVLLVLTVYVGLECLAVSLGYALLKRFLGLLRIEQEPRISGPGGA